MQCAKGPKANAVATSYLPHTPSSGTGRPRRRLPSPTSKRRLAVSGWETESTTRNVHLYQSTVCVRAPVEFHCGERAPQQGRSRKKSSFDTLTSTSRDPCTRPTCTTTVKGTQYSCKGNSNTRQRPSTRQCMAAGPHDVEASVQCPSGKSVIPHWGDASARSITSVRPCVGSSWTRTDPPRAELLS